MSTKIITFYSFKGGVGRTQALANIAVGLANGGRHVIVADMDLESPGLHTYFLPTPESARPYRDSDLADKRGFIDYLEHCATLPPEKPEIARMLLPCAHLNMRPGMGSIRLLSAGRLSEDYPARIASFSWDRFYTKQHGYAFMEIFREELTQSGADYVLIDSRTGMTDIANICTFQLPDAVVILFALHEQGIEGALRAALAIQAAREDTSLGARPERVLLLPSRVEEAGDPVARDDWVLRARARLSDCGTLLGDYGQRIPYAPEFAYGERVVTGAGEPNNLSNAYERLLEELLGAPRRASIPAPGRTSFRELRAHVDRLDQNVAALGRELDATRLQDFPLTQLRRLAHEVLRRRNSLLDEMNRIRDAARILSAECEMTPAELPDTSAEALDSAGDWSSVAQRTREAVELHIEAWIRTERKRVELRLLDVAEQDASLVEPALEELRPWIEAGASEEIQSRLPALEETIARSGLEALLRRGALDHARLSRSRPEPSERNEWLDERIQRVLLESSADDDLTTMLSNLLRLRSAMDGAPTHLHGSAFEMLCARVKADGAQAERAFVTIGGWLWTSAWTALLTSPATSHDIRELVGREAEDNLTRVLQSRPEACTALVHTIQDGLLRLWGEGKRTTAQERIRRRRDDPGLVAALGTLDEASTPARARRELLAAWLRSTDLTLKAAPVLRAYLHAVVEEEYEAEAFYALAALRHLGVIDGTDGTVALAFLLRALERGRGAVAASVLMSQDIERIAQSPVGRAVLLTLAWQPWRFPEEIQRLAPHVRIQLTHAEEREGALPPQLRALMEDPIEVDLSVAQDVRRLEELIRKEFGANRFRFYASWDSSRHYETDFCALVEGRLQALLCSRTPRTLEVESQRAAWSPEACQAWIDEALSSQRGRGVRTSAPDGDARKNIMRTFAEAQQNFVVLANFKTTSGMPSLEDVLNAERSAVASRRVLEDWLMHVALGHGGRVLAPRATELLAAYDPVPSAPLGAGLVLGGFPVDGTLFKVSPLLFDVDDKALDPLRYLDLMLEWSSGDRGLVEAARERLGRGDFTLAARCLDELLEQPGPTVIPTDLVTDLENKWQKHKDEIVARREQVEREHQTMLAERFDWPSARVLEDSLRESGELLSRLPVTSGTRLLHELASLEPSLLAKLNESIELAELARDDGFEARQRRQDDLKEKLRTAKEEVNRLLDDRWLRPDLTPEANRALEGLNAQAGKCLRERDLDGFQRLRNLLQRFDEEGAATVLLELGMESTPTPAPLPPPRPPAAPAPPRLALHSLSGLAKKSLGAGHQEKPKPSAEPPPALTPMVFSALAWDVEALAQQRDLARRVVRADPQFTATDRALAPAADRALGEYLMAEGKLSLLEDKPLRAATFFLDAYRWTVLSGSEGTESHHDIAASSLLLTTLFAYLSLRERRERSQAAEMTTAMQRRASAWLLPELDRRGVLVEHARIAAQMGAREGGVYLERLILPYLETHPRAAQAFVEVAVTDLAESLDGSGLTRPLLDLLLRVLDRLIPELRTAADVDLPGVLARAALLSDRSHAGELAGILRHLRGFVLPFAERYDLAYHAGQALEEQAKRLEEGFGPSFKLQHALLTPVVILGPKPKAVLQISLPTTAPLLRNLRVDVELLDGAGRALIDALSPPPLVPRLGPKERREIPLALAKFDLPRETILRVRYWSSNLEGVDRMLEARSENLSLTLESPPVERVRPLNPYVVGRAVQSPEGIYGREQEIGHIFQGLAGERQDNVILVSGERRIGKSTLLNAVELDPRFKQRYLILREDLQPVRHERSLTVVVRSRFVPRIRSRLKEAGIEVSPIQDVAFQEAPGVAFENFMREVDDALVAQDRRLLLIFDELDQLFENDQLREPVIALLRAVILSCKRVSFLLAGATEILRRHTATREDRLFRQAIEVPLKPLAEKAARQLIQEPTRAYFDLTQFATETILRETNRQPYLIQYVCSILFQEMLDRSVKIVTETDVEEVFSTLVVPRTEVFYDFRASIPDVEDFLIVTAMAMLQRGPSWVSTSDLRHELGRMGKALSDPDLSTRLLRLTETAPLVVERRLTTRAYRLQVGLFARHVRFIQGDTGAIA